MGFTSVDNFIAEVTGGKFWRQEFAKLYAGGVAIAGNWYDLAQGNGVPAQYLHGNMLTNADFVTSVSPWTLGSANWAYTPATHLVTRTANADVSTLSQNTKCVRGVSYLVVYTLVRTAGTFTISLGGTAGTGRTASATYRETIVCGATADAPCVITPDAAGAGTVDLVSVQPKLDFTPYNDLQEGSLWHGGDVSPDTKHLVNFGAWTNAATGVPSVLMLVDVLGVYSRILTTSAAAQTLTMNTVLYNGAFTGNADGWTLGAGWAYRIDDIERTASAVTTAYQSNLPIVAKCPYSVIYTIANRTAGQVTVSLGGTAGTARTVDGTYTETIIAGTDGTLTFTPDADFDGRIDTVSCTPKLPRCDEGTSTYGSGVRMFYVLDNALSNGANAANVVVKYTNQEGTDTRYLGATITNMATDVVAHLPHSGVGAGKYGPFLPFGAGDYGVRSVETFQFSAAQATADGAVNLVLCKPIASIPLTTAYVAAERDLMNQLPSLPRIRDGACLMFLVFTGAVLASGSQFQGYLDVAWS